MGDSRLSHLVRSARARIDPRRHGFPTNALRRVPGLRREEVAELIGVSATWYSRFESGRGKLSMAALARLCEVLELSPAQRRDLVSAARPEVAPQLGVGDCEDGPTWRRAVRDLWSASTLDEVLEGIVRALHDPRDGNVLSWGARFESDPQRLVFVASAGAIARPAAGDVQLQSRNSWNLIRSARTIACADVTLVATDEMRERVALGTRSYCATALVVNGVAVASFGQSYRRHQLPNDALRERLATLAYLGEMALRGIGDEPSRSHRTEWSIDRVHADYLEENVPA